jgi:hypothetical protein
MARLPALGFLKRERKRRTEGRAAKQKNRPKAASVFRDLVIDRAPLTFALVRIFAIGIGRPTARQKQHCGYSHRLL